MTVAIVAGAFALLGAIVSTSLQGWIASRSGVTADVRAERLEVYPAVWRLTTYISQWPTTDLHGTDVDDLHQRFRSWYYEVGGLYLSTNARKRYGNMQQQLELYASSPRSRSHDLVGPAEYEILMSTCSSFRSALTEDLHTRERPSLLSALSARREHDREEKAAEERDRAMRRLLRGEPVDKPRKKRWRKKIEKLEIPGATPPVITLDRVDGPGSASSLVLPPVPASPAD